MANVVGTPVKVYYDGRLGFSGGCPKVLDCNFTVIRNETINPLIGGDACTTYEAGTYFENGAPVGVDVVNTVKISTAKYGYLWVDATDLTTLKTACVACCVAH